MKILVIGPSWVGDMVMSQSLYKALKQQHPDAQIDVMAPAWCRPLLARMPEVSRPLEMPLGHGAVALGERRRLGRRLKPANYDQAIVLPGSFKSALVPWFAGIPRRTGWRGEMRYGLLNDLRVLDKAAFPLMVERYVALAYPKGQFTAGKQIPRPLPWPALSIDPAGRDKSLAELGLSTVRPVLVLCPGAEFGPSKRWPEAHYAQVAEAKLAEGWQVWLFGSAKDQPVAEAIRDLQPADMRDTCINLAGKTSLEQALDLMSLASAVISNDSGLMHVAAALNRPLVVPYGSTSPEFTPPLAERVKILHTDIECRPCFQRECPLGHLKCLTELEPRRVLSALDTLLAEGQ